MESLLLPGHGYSLPLPCPPFPSPTCYPDLAYYGLSLLAEVVKNLPAIQENLFQALGWEDPLEKRMATDSSILAW